MTEAAKFDRQIEKTTKDFERSYEKTIEVIREVKDRINKLESNISDKLDTEIGKEIHELNSLAEKLNESVDSLTLRSGAEWKEYRRLDQECKIRGYDPARLEGLKAIYKKTEELAKDMLCYSLARFKRKDQ